MGERTERVDGVYATKPHIPLSALILMSSIAKNKQSENMLILKMTKKKLKLQQTI